MTENVKQETGFREWCIVDLFGHQRLAGLVSEQAIGGCSFIRVDVPEIKSDLGLVLQPAMTRFFGQGAIYSISPVVEAVARQAAAAWTQPPVHRYQLPAERQRSREYDDDEDGFDPPPDPENVGVTPI
ncbi:hypothetical protein [Zavarzinia sp.]|uniref:hypothetical protein n=1 Tax=Zavarzinia sp. TaxID=2027920 RepID=UPI003564B0DA